MIQVLIALLFIVVYIVFVLVTPETECRKCGGWGQKKKLRRNRACSRCGGSGTQFRPGAPLVHRGKSLVIKHVRERAEGNR